MLSFKGMRFPIDVILVCIRWYVACPLSYRHLEKMMEKRGVSVHHSSIDQWANRFLQLIEKVLRKHAFGRRQQADGLNVHQSEKRLEIFLPRCR